MNTIFVVFVGFFFTYLTAMLSMHWLKKKLPFTVAAQSATIFFLCMIYLTPLLWQKLILEPLGLMTGTVSGKGITIVRTVIQPLMLYTEFLDIQRMFLFTNVMYGASGTVMGLATAVLVDTYIHRRQKKG